MSKERWFSREFAAGAGLVAAIGLGPVVLSGCTVLDRHAAVVAAPSPTPSPGIMPEPKPDCLLALEQLNIERSTKSGGVYATNEGDCVNVFGPELDDTTGPVGQIPTGETFYVECYDLTASGLRVNIKGSKGLLNMTEYAQQQVDDDPVGRSIRTC